MDTRRANGRLLSFEGRISRSEYWLLNIGYGTLGGGVDVLTSYINQDTKPMVLLALMIRALVSLLLLWPLFAVGVKRWHDRGKSGRWLWIALIPVVGIVWSIIECGFLKGTEGPNQYGEDPLERRAMTG